MQKKRTAIIIGAGPAGLTAALELLRQSDIVPIVCEASGEIGGLSRTVKYNGNRMDIGGHRFFSKSDWVMNWWREILPIQAEADAPERQVEISYQNKKRMVDLGHEQSPPDVDDQQVMLVRGRLSRIYYLRKYFDYPIKLNLLTMRNLGPVRLVRIGLSYLRASLFPRRQVKSLEDFIINRFGKELYLTFFKSYTEKVWGTPCSEISAEWGAQRIKGLSVGKALLHAVRKVVAPFRTLDEQKGTQTSLIERFLYPKHGPGALWEEVADRVRQGGGEVLLNHRVAKLQWEGASVRSVTLVEAASGAERKIEGDFFFSTMPVKDLVLGVQPEAPVEVRRVAAELPYRDFITVGLQVRRMQPNRQSGSRFDNHMLPDNWIYIQEPDVKLGRLQVFNNWSPGLVSEPGKIWLGLEYFCQEGDDIWSLSDQAMSALAIGELAKIGLIDPSDVESSVVIRVPKAYPAYFGSYKEFDVIRSFVDRLDNLFLIGRNGMHRYNNQDHSMLTARLAVENVVMGQAGKENIWAVNVDDEYHEEKARTSVPG